VRRIWTATYPAAFGVAYILLSFGAFPTPTTGLLRPLLLVILVSTVLVVVIGLLVRSLPKAAVIVSVAMVALSAPFLLVAVAAAAVVIVGFQVARRRWSLATLRATSAEAVSRAASIFALAFAAVSVAVAAPALASGVFIGGHPQATGTAAGLPNIYLLLLDGYPRSDTLRTVYDYDNSWFVDALRELGFETAEQSRSNYPQTPLTLASMFNGAYLDEIGGLHPPPESAVEQYRRLMSAVNRAPMLDTLRMAGYEIDTIPSPFKADALSTADRTFDSGQITSFEYSLLMHSQLAPLIVRLVPDFLMSQERDLFHATLDRLVAGAAAARDKPTVTFAHVFSPPHAPLVYGRNGEHLALPSCIPDPCQLWAFPPGAWDHLPDQIHYTNGEVLKAVRQIIRDDPTGIVILMSDHGSRRDIVDLDEFFHNFFAARTPGQEVFPADVSPVNVLRLLIAAETDVPLEPVPYRAWFFADEERPLELTPFEPSP
jgi:hypothetical protein